MVNNMSHIPEAPGIQDRYSRVIDYLRVSVTDRCNLRCTYCMPPEGVTLLDHEDILSFEEIVAVVTAGAELGISKVRITGGEPLVRPGLCDLVRALSHVDGLDDLSLTTNGTLLKYYAAELKAAGLKRVNISLDSLRPDRFLSITRQGHLEDTLSGIEAAQVAGLMPIKINTVVMRGINDDEVKDIAVLARMRGWSIRFVERMPLSGNEGGYVPSSEVLGHLSPLGTLDPQLPAFHNGPARCYSLKGTGSVGFISPMSEPFCSTCNRLRLTSTGMLRPCLLSDAGTVDIKTPLREGADKAIVQDLLLEAVSCKPGSHSLKSNGSRIGTAMSQIGG